MYAVPGRLRLACRRGPGLLGVPPLRCGVVLERQRGRGRGGVPALRGGGLPGVDGRGELQRLFGGEEFRGDRGELDGDLRELLGGAVLGRPSRIFLCQLRRRQSFHGSRGLGLRELCSRQLPNITR